MNTKSERVQVSDLALLSSALEEALDAYESGVIVGPTLDTVALARAMRRARHQDVARVLRTSSVPAGGAA